MVRFATYDFTCVKTYEPEYAEVPLHPRWAGYFPDKPATIQIELMPGVSHRKANKLLKLIFDPTEGSIVNLVDKIDEQSYIDIADSVKLLVLEMILHFYGKRYHKRIWNKGEGHLQHILIAGGWDPNTMRKVQPAKRISERLRGCMPNPLAARLFFWPWYILMLPMDLLRTMPFEFRINTLLGAIEMNDSNRKKIWKWLSKGLLKRDEDDCMHEQRVFLLDTLRHGGWNVRKHKMMHRINKPAVAWLNDRHFRTWDEEVERRLPGLVPWAALTGEYYEAFRLGESRGVVVRQRQYEGNPAPPSRLPHWLRDAQVVPHSAVGYGKKKASSTLSNTASGSYFVFFPHPQNTVPGPVFIPSSSCSSRLIMSAGSSRGSYYQPTSGWYVTDPHGIPMPIGIAVSYDPATDTRLVYEAPHYRFEPIKAPALLRVEEVSLDDNNDSDSAPTTVGGGVEAHLLQLTSSRSSFANVNTLPCELLLQILGHLAVVGLPSDMLSARLASKAIALALLTEAGGDIVRRRIYNARYVAGRPGFSVFHRQGFADFGRRVGLVEELRSWRRLETVATFSPKMDGVLVGEGNGKSMRAWKYLEGMM